MCKKEQKTKRFFWKKANSYSSTKFLMNNWNFDSPMYLGLQKDKHLSFKCKIDCAKAKPSQNVQLLHQMGKILNRKKLMGAQKTSTEPICQNGIPNFAAITKSVIETLKKLRKHM